VQRSHHCQHGLLALAVPIHIEEHVALLLALAPRGLPRADGAHQGVVVLVPGARGGVPNVGREMPAERRGAGVLDDGVQPIPRLQRSSTQALVPLSELLIEGGLLYKSAQQHADGHLASALSVKDLPRLCWWASRYGKV
jgi:hypothetical protein